MAELKALIFDVDGTLAETERDAHRVAFNATFKQFGLDWYWSEALYGDLLKVTGGKERIRYYINDFGGKVPDNIDDLDSFIAELHKDKTARYYDIMVNENVPLRPGIARLFKEAREAGLTLAISTTTSPKNIEALLAHNLDPEAMSWFKVVAAGDMVKQKKPAPDVYQLALDGLELPANQCIAFEDSINGLKSAKGVDLPTVITVSGYTNHEDFTGADIVLTNLGEPDAPMEVIAGDVGDADYITIDVLKKLAAQW
ncbi:HAD family hydrolase [Candidatus Albibeggiatoa sp. nov. NOAA]|uniref:HAD family hydrolase n=1 Tax=Candidatus Albibeggiatoa sp. nov. NOAA TaxID=3162724 RepID=UPI0032FB70CE|nr:HAD family hydrolase [Thiotrichaceae bacterium]